MTDTNHRDNIFLYVDSPIGSGKTHDIIEYTGFGAIAGQCFIVAQPTTDLIDQTCRQFKARFPDVPCVAIHSEISDNVAAELKKQTEDAGNEFVGHGMVVICSHSGLIQAPFIAEKKNWHVIMDEMPQTLYSGRLSLARNAHLISQVFTIRDDETNGHYSKLMIADENRLDDMSRDDNELGVFSHTVQEMARKINSGWWRMFVLTNQWNEVMHKRKADQLIVYGHLRPEILTGFKSTTCVSANLKNTLAHHHLIHDGYRFMKHKMLGRRLRYHTHENGELLTIFYAINEKWTKRIRNTMYQGKSIQELIATAATTEFGDAPFAKLTNKDSMRDKDPFGDQGVSLPHAAYGRNDFQHLHNAAVIPALNPPTDFFAFVSNVIGIDAEDVYQAIYREQVYQASGRISIRLPGDLNPKKIVVADLSTAEFLAKMYPGAVVKKMPIAFAIPPPKSPGRQTERRPQEQELHRNELAKMTMRRTRWKAKHAVVLNPLSTPIGVRYNTGIHDDNHARTQNEAQPGFAISLWDSRAAKPRPHVDYGLGHMAYKNNLITQRFYTTEQFFDHLMVCAETKYHAEKHDNDLVVTALFDLSKDPGRGHTKKNHVVSQGLMLDLENTDLTPEEIHAALPYAMLVYASWNHAPDAPRYRVCIPTLPMSYDAQEASRRVLVRLLELAYPDRRIGVDRGKLNPVSLMYLPCVRPEMFLPLMFDGAEFDHIDIVRSCPPDIIDEVISKSPLTEPEEEAAEAAEVKIAQAKAKAPPSSDINVPGDWVRDRAIKTWQSRGTIKGPGRMQFWSLARSLIDRTTLSHGEIRQILWEQAGHANNPSERRGEIDAFFK